jgi:eukaryotic-like serine/threonine-protein kinase
MSAEGPVPRDGDTGATTEEAELAQVLESYLAQLEAGRPADPEELVAAHPELARPLRACLKVMHLAHGLDDSEKLPAGLRAVDPDGFETAPPMGSSALTALWPGDDRPPRVLLPEPPEDDSQIVRMRSDALSDSLGGAAGRYQVLGEIARGGMGVVLKARDSDLGRDLALKVLLDRHRGDQDVVRRFVEEAQIGGQLQHPGIVPVHELGTLADLRPFFAMRLVKGRTLAALLAERPRPAASVGRGSPEPAPGVGRGSPDPALPATGGLQPAFDDLPRFLAIFEAVCQTMAYAHARRVIHRDLKPANVMVGNFGEVQVMDWGLAKVLPEGGIADEQRARAASEPESLILTVRSGSAGSGSESQAGSVLGTPAYMAPEQARGEVERIDERADVFGLGAILCEILTGRPPYVGLTREEIRDKAARGDLADALDRLAVCRADAELVSLARACLAAEPQRRPRSAGEVSGRLTAYLAGVQDRLKAAELARVEAQARAEEAQARARLERSRRRRTMALAASVLVTAGVLGGGWTYLARQHTARLVATTRVVTDALAEAERFHGEAQSAALGDLAKWSAALGAAQRARDLLAEGEADNALRERVTAVMVDLEREQGVAQERAADLERDRKLLGELETIRTARSEHWDPKQADAGYAAAFRAFGLDLDQLDPQEAGMQIKGRSDPVALVSFLDDWAVQRWRARIDEQEASWRRLIGAAKAADPDPWRGAVRDLIGRDDQKALWRLADDQKAQEDQPAGSLLLLGSALSSRVDPEAARRGLIRSGPDYPTPDRTDPGDRERALRVLRLAWRIDPGDFWVNSALARISERPVDKTRFYSAAVALRPRSCMAHFRLGTHFMDQGDWNGAIDEFRSALRIKELYAAHVNLNVVFTQAGRWDEAVAEGRTLVRLAPNNLLSYLNLGTALSNAGQVEEAIATFRSALRLKRNAPLILAGLGVALRKHGEFTEALAASRQARELAKTDPRACRQIEEDLAETERQASLTARLPAMLAGTIKPADAGEALGFAGFCYKKKLYGASARFWANGFQAQPELADDMKAQNRYNAARAAALAGSGQGKDEHPLDNAAKARWRTQAIDWLKADLAAWSKILDGGPPQARQAIPQTLQHWKTDTDLAGLRDGAALANLPAEEQQVCRALWDEVDTVLAKAKALVGTGNPNGFSTRRPGREHPDSEIS